MLTEKLSSELTRQELLSGHYRDKYGRLRDEKGRFIHEAKNDSPDYVPIEEVHAWYEKHWKTSQVKQVSRNLYMVFPKAEPILSNRVKEGLCILGVAFGSTILFKLLEWFYMTMFDNL